MLLSQGINVSLAESLRKSKTTVLGKPLFFMLFKIFEIILDESSKNTKKSTFNVDSHILYLLSKHLSWNLIATSTSASGFKKPVPKFNLI
jgi:hypothetical protein